jgi:hypothetical protein
LVSLDLPDLSCLKNDPIQHAPFWSAVPTKLQIDTLKFDEKPVEDPNNHVMNFHLWCSSNSLMEDSIGVRIFQRTLIGTIVKWYIELSHNSFVDFNSLSMDFLTHLWFPICYETHKKKLKSLRKSSSTHISDHIHEWRQWRRFIKAPIPEQLLADWFTKSLFPPIAHDVAMVNVFTEEKAIIRAQYLDLVYSQSNTLYDLIPNAPR